MLTKFQRNYQLQVLGNDGQLHTFAYPLTMEFQVKRNTLQSANTGNFKIYNLGQHTRNAIYKDYYSQTLSFRSLIVSAGYGNFNNPSALPIIFNGNVMQASSYRIEKSVNYITEIDGYDYAWPMANGKTTFNAPSGSLTTTQIITRLVADLQSTVPLDPNNKGVSLSIGAISPQYNVPYNQNVAIVGNTWDALQNITNNQTYIDNGRVYSLFENDVFSGDLQVISNETGILGSPRKQDRLVIVEMLFEPRINIGQQVKIISPSLSQYPTDNNGVFKVVGVEHHGTISAAVSGDCKTIVTCLLPFEKINLINAGM